jgi:hypothetical protein
VGTGRSGAMTDYALNTWLNGSLNNAGVVNDGAGGLQTQPNSKSKFANITDGTSNTLFIGSKQVITDQYELPGGGYDETLFQVNGGVNRNGRQVIKDNPTSIASRNWGSPFDACPMGMADGSVRMIRYGLDIDTIGLRRPDDGIVNKEEL